MYLLYSILFAGLLVLGLPYLVFRSLRERGYARSLLERFVPRALPDSDAPSIWIHAVSVGEVMAAATLVPALRRAIPETRIVVSVITVTGRRVAENKLAGEVAAIFYCPFDFAWIVRPVVRRVRPRALVILETEIWPHLLRESRRAGAVTLLASGRISDRSFPRYLKIAGFMKRFLESVSVFCMQSPLYAERIEALGAPRERIRITGSLKFDAVPEAAAEGGRVLPPGRRVFVGGSTFDPEEAILLSLLEPLRRDAPDLLLVLAPRHPPRFDAVFELARRLGLRVARRSTSENIPEDTDVVILDTLGELAALYAEADYVFVGGSLASWGGHNIIEPASKEKPVVFGPHMENFTDIARLFLEEDAVVQVEDAAGLEEAVRGFIRHPAEAHELAARAKRVVDENRGAAVRTADALREILG